MGRPKGRKWGRKSESVLGCKNVCIIYGQSRTGYGKPAICQQVNISTTCDCRRWQWNAWHASCLCDRFHRLQSSSDESSDVPLTCHFAAGWRCSQNCDQGNICFIATSGFPRVLENVWEIRNNGMIPWKSYLGKSGFLLFSVLKLCCSRNLSRVHHHHHHHHSMTPDELWYKWIDGWRHHRTHQKQEPWVSALLFYKPQQCVVWVLSLVYHAV